MRLTLTLDTTAGRRRFETFAEAVADLSEPLRAFGKYLREKAKQRFASGGPGWPALAPATLRSAQASFIRKSGGLRLRGKLARQVAKAAPEVRAALQSATRSTGGGAIGAALRAASSGAIADKAFARIAKKLDREMKAMIKEGTPQTAKEAARAAAAKPRATKKHKLLGKLASTIRATVGRGELEVFSIVPWAGVHNAGGTNGKGAPIPPRTFLELEPEDGDKLAALIADHITSRQR